MERKRKSSSYKMKKSALRQLSGDAFHEKYGYDYTQMEGYQGLSQTQQEFKGVFGSFGQKDQWDATKAARESWVTNLEQEKTQDTA